jgi:hypothetical protein
MFWSGTTAGDGGLVCSSRREGKTVHLYVKGGYIQRHSDMLAILSFVAIVLLVGSGIYYLGESIHAPMQVRIFAGPVSTI